MQVSSAEAELERVRVLMERLERERVDVEGFVENRHARRRRAVLERRGKRADGR